MEDTSDGHQLLMSTPIAQAEYASLRAPAPPSTLRRSQRFSPFTPRNTPPRDPAPPPQSPAVNVRLFQSPSRPSRSVQTRMSAAPAPAISRPPASAQKTGRPRDEIWDHYRIERENGKMHGRCRYCQEQVKNGKPSGNLLKHLLKKCPRIPPSDKKALQKPQQVDGPTVCAQASTLVSESSGMTQDEFDMALATVFFVCSLPFVLIEAEVFRDFLNQLAPTMNLPTRQRIGGDLLELATAKLRKDVIHLINKQGHVSVVTDGWSDTNSSSIINFMVVAPGMPSLFWCSWSTRSERHTAKYLAREMERVILEIQSETTATVTGIVTDNASNMTSAWTTVMNKLPNVIGGGCAAHVLNLLMHDVCQHPAIQAVQARALAITRFVKDHLALLDEFKTIQASARALGARTRGLVLPVPTRWYSVHACLRNVQNSRDQLEELFLSEKYAGFRERYQGTVANRRKLSDIIVVLRDDNFWANLRTIIRLTDPIIEALRELESDNSFASSVYKWFRKLKFHDVYGVRSPQEEADGERRLQEELYRQQRRAASSGGEDDDDDDTTVFVEAETLAGLSEARPPEDVDPAAPSQVLLTTGYTAFEPIALGELQHFFRQRIQERWEYVHTNAMGVAFFLDPTTDLDQFVGTDEARAREQACSLAQRSHLFPRNSGVPELVAELLKYARMKRQAGQGGRSMYSKSRPVDYWDSEKKTFPTLARIAEVVFSIPTSSAASERAWSIFDHIHSKKRNRLSVQKVEMLAYMYINYGTTKKQSVDLARHQSHPDSIDLDDGDIVTPIQDAQTTTPANE